MTLGLTLQTFIWLVKLVVLFEWLGDEYFSLWYVHGTDISLYAKNPIYLSPLSLSLSFPFFFQPCVRLCMLLLFFFLSPISAIPITFLPVGPFDWVLAASD